MNLYPNIISRDGNTYEILRAINKSMFTNKDGSLNKQVLGLYVAEVKADRVLEVKGKLLICKEIEDAKTET
jgi:hypothetical protein